MLRTGQHHIFWEFVKSRIQIQGNKLFCPALEMMTAIVRLTTFLIVMLKAHLIKGQEFQAYRGILKS